MRITILAVLLLISTSISGQILEKDILGAWQASESATYNFSETGGQLVLTVVYKQDNEGDWKTLLFGGGRGWQYHESLLGRRNLAF
jgi:hypothetical protein